MAATRFEEHNASYSAQMHDLARQLVYPQLLNVNSKEIEFEELTLVGQSDIGDMLDGDFGIDRVARVQIPGIVTNRRLAITVQERFRRPKWASKQDITITEWNNASDMPSELYKIRADIFLYGYAAHDEDDTPVGFQEVIAIDTTRLIMAIASKQIEISSIKENKKDQTFITISLKSLRSCSGLVLWEQRNLKKPAEIFRLLLDKYPESVWGEIHSLMSLAVTANSNGGYLGD